MHSSAEAHNVDSKRPYCSSRRKIYCVKWSPKTNTKITCGLCSADLFVFTESAPIDFATFRVGLKLIREKKKRSWSCASIHLADFTYGTKAGYLSHVCSAQNVHRPTFMVSCNTNTYMYAFPNGKSQANPFPSRRPFPPLLVLFVN